MFALDSSGSVGSTNWGKLLDFMEDVVDHYGLVKIGNDGVDHFFLDEYTTDFS